MTKQVLLGFTKHSIASFAARSMSSVSRAWNPEVEYNISKDFLAHITLLNPNNVSTSIQTARARLERLNREIDAVESVVALKPERMVHHAILVPTLTHIGLHDGEEYLSLGNSFREKERLVRRYVTPHIPAILDEFNTFRNSVENDVAREVGGFSTAHRQEEVLSNWRKILKNESGLSSTE